MASKVFAWLSVVLATAVGGLLLGGPASAAAHGKGSLTGYGFDACSAPPQAVMDAWWQQSPYAAVGVYIGGSNRLCDQPELTPGWVHTQQHRGWLVLPIFVGPQASCSGYADTMSADQPTAEQQGRAQAATAISAARGLGLGAGTTIYYDLEDYDIGPDDCRRAALSFLSGWSDELHARHYLSGVYSNLAAAITSLDYADRVSSGSYTMPDQLWFSWANNHADTRTDERVRSHRWDDHARIHQYVTGTTESYGGYSLTVDRNWLDVGKGSTRPSTAPLCRGVDVDLRSYPTLKPGRHGPVVAAAQCLLRHQHLLRAPITGRYDQHTVAAVKKAQHRLHQKVTGTLTRRTWTALLARGTDPVLKVGSTGTAVLRLQRALTAAGSRTSIDGLYSTRTAKAVAAFQRRQGLPATGVVTTAVWAGFAGQAGRQRVGG